MEGERWRPEVLGAASTRGLRYLVVDEIFASLAELALAPWPVVDVSGRLRFPDEETVHLEVDVERMRRYLRRHRQPRRGAGRELRTGDVFGVRVDPRALARFLRSAETAAGSPRERERMLDPATWDWMHPPVRDLSAQARIEAKLAYYGSLSESLPEATDER